jgi:transposase
MSINVIICFWAYAIRKLAKSYGVNDSTFYLHLNDCEFRFNLRGTGI